CGSFTPGRAAANQGRSGLGLRRILGAVPQAARKDRVACPGAACLTLVSLRRLGWLGVHAHRTGPLRGQKAELPWVALPACGSGKGNGPNRAEPPSGSLRVMTEPDIPGSSSTSKSDGI